MIYSQDIIDNFNKSQEDLFNYFGIRQVWKVYPISDDRKYVWRIDDNVVLFADSKYEFETESRNVFSNEIINKQIYRKEKYTAILSDPRSDRNPWYSIFDNSKEFSII